MDGGAGGAGAPGGHQHLVAHHVDEFDVAAVLLQGRPDFPGQGVFDQLNLLDVGELGPVAAAGLVSARTRSMISWMASWQLPQPPPALV